PRLLERAAALDLPVYEGYGLSECASVVCLNRPGAQRPGSVGRVLPHTGVRISADGEVLVTGPRFLGYRGEGPPPAGPYATGDLGAFDADGFLSLRGRRKAMYITAWGRNVSPEWIESELTQHPAIAQALAWGEGRTQAVALLVPRRADATEA
ncbi:MAG: long-chain acyl-CoA synthetase, partial [Gemmatimonas sp.]